MGPALPINIVILAILLNAGCLEGSMFKPTLKAVSMLTRHGDRSPEFLYPKDPYKDYPWAGGLGALSPKGEDQLYQSGKIKAKRYSTLLAPSCLFCSFSVDNIHVESSAFPRCIKSGTKFLEAFIPVPWSPSIINVTPMEEDEYLGLGKMCPKYMKEIVTSLDYNNPAYSQIMDFQSEEGKQFVEYFEQNTGYNFMANMLIVDTIQVEKDNGLPMPAWAAPIFEKYMAPSGELSLAIMGSTDLMRIRSGILLRETMNRLESFLNNTAKSNIILYSAHDLNIIGLMALLDIRKQVPARPDYGSMVNLEIYDNIAVLNDVEIRIVYFRNYGDENPIEIEIPGCKAPCAFKKFKASVESKYIWNYDVVCAK